MQQSSQTKPSKPGRAPSSRWTIQSKISIVLFPESCCSLFSQVATILFDSEDWQGGIRSGHSSLFCSCEWNRKYCWVGAVWRCLITPEQHYDWWCHGHWVATCLAIPATLSQPHHPPPTNISSQTRLYFISANIKTQLTCQILRLHRTRRDTRRSVASIRKVGFLPPNASKIQVTELNN